MNANKTLHVSGLGGGQKKSFEAKSRIAERSLERGITNITYKITIKTHKRLRHIALEENTTLQQLMDEALDLLLKKRGEEPAELKPTKRGANE